MGITTDSLKRIQKFGILDSAKEIRMLELGCQNIYDDSFKYSAYGMIAKHWFANYDKINHKSWDILGCQLAEKVDLRIPIDVSITGKFDVITDFGTTEHIDNTEIGGFYEAQKNIHNLCEIGGIIIHENPKTGHWIGHGCNYVTQEFYLSLIKDMEYELLELSEHFAMGNTIDGCNINCVFRKVKEKEFITKEIFNTYDFRTS